jgi:hypothetical protein
MARVLTNNVQLRSAIEASIGVLPGTPAGANTEWEAVEFENISAYGAVITTVARRPISQDRGRKKGTVTDLDSSVEFDTDLTVDAFVLFAEGFMFAEYANVEFNLREGTAPTSGPPSVDGSNDEFNINAASALLAGKVQFGTGFGTLLYAKGYANAANNGLHILDVDLTTSQTAIGVTSDLVDEASPPANATLEVCGIRTDDFTLTIDSGLATGTLVSAGDIDPTTLGLQVGQIFHIGGTDTAGAVANAPTVASTTVFGYARVTALSSTTITFDKADVNLGLGGAGSSSGSETIDVMFGRFARNVPVTADSDDSRYLERSYQFEATYPDLGGVGTDEYEYAVGNFANELTFNLPLTNKATVTFAFVGTNSDDITPTRKTTRFGAVSATVAGGGSGYTDNDVLTLVGGTGTAATFTATVVAGAVTAVTLTTPGSYSVVPTNPVSVTGGTGTGATLTVTFAGIDDPARQPLRTTAFNTSSGIVSITTDVLSSVSEVCFKSLTLTILNNVSPEKCLGTLGATFVNAGLFEANLEGQMLFTNKSIVNAIRNNTTVTLQFIMLNEDGAIAVDMPELTLGGGGREFPVDQSVLVNITGASFTSNTFGHDLGVSLFAAVPGIAA